MATLKAMFKLFDGYTTTIEKINRKTDEAMEKILEASGATDKFNKKLENTGASAGNAGSGLKKLLGIVGLLAGAKKGMDITDSFVNTDARLKLINDGLQTQAELQDKIYAAANRSRGAYGDMASAVSRLQMLAGDAFTSNDETIAFTEVVQKSFAVGGADKSEQSAAMHQLSQAMASGRLQGDEFTSISENAPLILEAISKYTGKSRGELKELSSEGAITADIIKNSMFAMSNEIDDKFSEMPLTFADIWTRISNGAGKAFKGVMARVNGLINTDGFQSFVDVIIAGFNILSGAVNGFIDFVINNWPLIQAVLMVAAVAFAVLGTAALISGIKTAAAWAMANAPLLMAIAIISGIIYALRKMGVSWEEIFSFIGGIVGVTIAGIWNLFVGWFELVLGLLNFLIDPIVYFTNFFGNVFKNPISSVIYLFQGMADSVLKVIEKIASAMDFVFGSNMADTVGSWRTGLKDMADKAVEKYAPNENYQKIMDDVDFKASDFGIERMEYGKSWSKGREAGKNIYGDLNNALNGLTGPMANSGLGDFGTSSKPLTIEGKGKGKSVKVDMSNEDLKYLRDIAERDYINKFSTATLAPNISVTFGDVHETADADKVAGRIKKILQEEIAMTAEGV